MKKIIGRAVGIILAGIVLFVTIFASYQHLKMHGEAKQLRSEGYGNLVSVGDYSLNVYKCGKDNGDHRIVCLSGFLDGEAFLSWRGMTKEVEKNNELYFIDRAGYGLSEDTKNDMTVEYVVEDYRKALKNAGVQAPYILMGHSLGGIYSAYWESHYPDEIEGVVIWDGVPIYPIEKDQYSDWDFFPDWMHTAGKFGLIRAFIKTVCNEDDDEDGGTFALVDEGHREIAWGMIAKSMGSNACDSEEKLFGDNIRKTWDTLEKNDIPKVYVAATTYDIEYDSFDIYTPFVEKLGNCQMVELPGWHEIYLDKPKECSDILMNFMDQIQ
ncbi:MAG: alpha/beta hydrolase [Treponema sp.]|jgi:pimeloyl-ACP methyl ester carboxylesterase|nr:alpha/beta hydrolase [Treponema sp.]